MHHVAPRHQNHGISIMQQHGTSMHSPACTNICTMQHHGTSTQHQHLHQLVVQPKHQPVRVASYCQPAHEIAVITLSNNAKSSGQGQRRLLFAQAPPDIGIENAGCESCHYSQASIMRKQNNVQVSGFNISRKFSRYVFCRIQQK